MTTEGSLGSLLIHTLLSPRYGYDLERIDRMSSPLSLDFNPRSLVVDSSISYSLASDKPSPSLDAIFVPFRSRPEYVSELLKILPENETPIFLLPTSSLDLNSVEMGRRRHVEAIFMDNPDFTAILNGLRCSSNRLCMSYFVEWDLPAKRNYALWYARKHRLNRIMLLDDDIRDLQSTAFVAGANALQDFIVSGFFVDDFPDTSAIGHAEIELGESVFTFLSGSCLFARTDNDVGFFPPIYNEDWLFMVPHIARGRVCSLGRVCQKSYDPFANPAVALFQEFGEIIADSLFALVASNRYSERFNPRVWRKLLNLRHDWLMELSNRTSDDRHRSIIEVAQTKCAEITEADCVRFMSDWESDRKQWDQTLQELI